MCAALFLLFACLFSLAILQSDDYYYAKFWRGGLLEFLKLTKDHFLTFNGRAAVHAVAQTVLSLPTPFYPIIASAVLLGAVILALKYFKSSSYNLSDCFFFAALFYILLMLSGRCIIREALMWKSAFFNYVMPLVFLFGALVCIEKHFGLSLILTFLAGAATEQWGIASTALFALLAVKNVREKNMKYLLFPVLSALGCFTVFLSPATRLRMVSAGKFLPSDILGGFVSLSKVFMNRHSAVLVMLIFIAVSISFALTDKKMYPLIFGFVPFVLIIASLFLPTAPAAFFSFLIYLAVCTAVFFSEHFKVSVVLFAAAAAAAAVVPAGMYEYRVAAPAILLIIASTCALTVSLIYSFSFTSKHKFSLYPCFVLVFSVLALTVFMPSYVGFKHNFDIDQMNMRAIKTARETKIYEYNIDYDKNYAMRQMFNDGWFYDEFLALYSLEDCTVRLTSDIYPDTVVNGRSLGIAVPCENGNCFIPVRALLNELGGSIEIKDGNVIMKLDNHTLTYGGGIFTYDRISDGKTLYEAADPHKNSDFVHLSVTPDILKEAFGLKITKDQQSINIIYP